MAAWPASRKGLLCLAACIAFVVLSWTHLSLLTQVAYSYGYWLRPEVHWAPSTVPSANEAVVPRIMHQTWQTRDVPAKWAAARQSCLDLHPDYEHRLWTDEDGLKFIEEHYPWFLPTYLSYPYNIQRVDVVRYFILHKFGGIYIDLDMGCRHKLDFMLYNNFTAPMTHPVGISNDVMAARPGDAYLSYVLPRLRRWNAWMGIKYIQVMFSTGPMFLTVQYSMFPRRSDVAIISKPDYGKYDFSGDAHFYHLHGSSWHADDAQLIFWLDRHKLVLVLLGSLVAAGGAGLVLLRCVVAHRYRQLKLTDD